MAGNLTAMIAAAFSGSAAPPVTSDPYYEYTTLLLPGNGTTGNRTVATKGMASLLKVATDTWWVTGPGVT